MEKPKGLNNFKWFPGFPWCAGNNAFGSSHPIHRQYYYVWRMYTVHSVFVHKIMHYFRYFWHFMHFLNVHSFPHIKTFDLIYCEAQSEIVLNHCFSHLNIYENTEKIMYFEWKILHHVIQGSFGKDHRSGLKKFSSLNQIVGWENSWLEI